MDSFEFEVDGYKFRVSSNDGHAYTCIEEFRDGKWKYLSDHTFVTTHAFRALLANRAEVMALYREAMDNARRWAEVLDGNMGSNARISKLDSLDARFKKMDVGQ